MNEKDIQSFSLATLIDVCGRRPGDICYDGCLIASRVNVQDEIDIDLFRYPTRIDAFVILFCSKGSGTFTSNLTRHTLTENSIFVHLPGSIIQAESTEEIALHAVICEEEFIRRINIDIRLLSQLFLHVEKQPCLKLDEKEWTGITRSFEELGAEGTEMPADVYSAEVIRSIIRTLAYKVCRVIGRHIETSGERQVSARRSRGGCRAIFISASITMRSLCPVPAICRVRPAYARSRRSWRPFPWHPYPCCLPAPSWRGTAPAGAAGSAGCCRT